MKYITLAALKRNGACSYHRRLFVRTFGTKAMLTEENFKKAIDAGLDVNWLMGLLSGAEWTDVINKTEAEYLAWYNNEETEKGGELNEALLMARLRVALPYLLARKKL